MKAYIILETACIIFSMLVLHFYDIVLYFKALYYIYIYTLYYTSNDCVFTLKACILCNYYNIIVEVALYFYILYLTSK